MRTIFLILFTVCSVLACTTTKEVSNQGFKLEKVQQNSIYSKIGLRSGDIVKEINGQKLTSASDTIRILNGLSNKKQSILKIERKGKTETINVR